MTTAFDIIEDHAEPVVSTEGLPDEQWHGERQKGVGGSDAAAACGLSDWKSPYSLWEEKVNGAVPKLETEAMYWGKVLEDPVARRFARESGLTVERYPWIVRSRKYPWMLANLDRVGIEDTSVVECKTSSLANRWEGEDAPDEVVLQGMHYLGVTGLERCHIPALINLREFKVFTVERDEQWIEDLAETERKFWELVQANTPPPIDGSASTQEALKRMYGTAEEGRIADLTLYRDFNDRNIIDLLKMRAAAKAQIKAAQGDVDWAENNIKAALGVAEIGTFLDRVVVTWKQLHNKGHVTEPFDYRRLFVPKGVL